MSGELLRRTRRELEPARLGWVRLSEVFAPRPMGYHGATIQDRAYDIGVAVPGELLGWCRLSNGALHLHVLQLVSTATLTIRSPADLSPPDSGASRRH